jgi:hypothetical protein
MMTPEAALDLRKPFPPESVGKLPKGGAMLDYVGHAAVTDRLLTVDPHWSWEPMALDEHGLPALDRAGNLWIKLTICGVTRIGVGDGKSAKECIGDAIRNAAMRFGVALDLWAKENLVEFQQAATASHGVAGLRAAVAAPSAPEPAGEPAPAAESAPITQTQMKALHASFNDAGISDREQRLAYCRNLTGRELESSKDLTRDEASKVIDALKQDATEAQS